MTKQVDSELLERARQAGIEAGRELASRFGRKVETRMKGADDPVTEADLAAAGVLRAALLRPPVTEWLCEEASDVPTGRTFWAVDPMDGTKAFLNGQADFTVSIALVDAGVPVIGVIYNPMTGEMFSASRGDGLQLELLQGTETGRPGKAVPLESVPLEESRLILSRTELGKGQMGELPKVAQSVTASGSIAYKMARVSSGEFHGTLSRTPKSLWDVAAGALLLEEAGGMVTDLAGEPLDGRPEERHGVVAAAPGLHASLMAYLEKNGLNRIS